MLRLARSLTHRLRGFWRDDAGTYVVESLIILPALIWAVMALITFFDAYRMQTLNLRATYVIGDAISRMWDPVSDAYFEGLEALHALQVAFAYDTDLRVSVVQWSTDNDVYILRWTQSSDTAKLPLLTQADMLTMTGVIPTLADGDSMILVETVMAYTPPFSVGLPAMDFDNYIFVSPRYVAQVVHE